MHEPVDAWHHQACAEKFTRANELDRARSEIELESLVAVLKERCADREVIAAGNAAVAALRARKCPACLDTLAGNGQNVAMSTQSKATLWKTHPASAEGSAYEGEYRGTAIRLVRVTDLGYWPGHNPTNEKDATYTYWDGYVAEGGSYRRGGTYELDYGIVAEHYATRREALAKLERYIDGVIEGAA